MLIDLQYAGSKGIIEEVMGIMAELASSNKKHMRMSVVVPAYDEEKSLPILIERFLHAFEKNTLKGEIIHVNC